MLEKPVLSFTDSFYLGAYWALYNSGPADHLAFMILNGLSSEELADIRYVNNALRKHEEKEAKARAQKKKKPRMR